MSNQHNIGWTRRHFLSATALAGTGALLRSIPQASATEPPPETPRIKLVQTFSMCEAPQFVAEELLRVEGFT